MRSCSTFAGSSCLVSPSRRETRPTCVSTGNACAAPRWTRTTPGGLPPHPGQRLERLARPGDAAPVLAAIACIAATIAFALFR